MTRTWSMQPERCRTFLFPLASLSKKTCQAGAPRFTCEQEESNKFEYWRGRLCPVPQEPVLRRTKKRTERGGREFDEVPRLEDTSPETRGC